MRLTMAQPCSGSRVSIWRISRSRVPCRRADGLGMDDTSNIDNNTSTFDNVQDLFSIATRSSSRINVGVSKAAQHRILLILLAGALFLYFYGSGQAYRS